MKSKKKHQNSFIIVFLIILLTLGGLAYFTKPQEQEQRLAISEKINTIVTEIIRQRDEPLLAEVWSVYGSSFIQHIVATQVVVDDYFLFSVSKIEWDNNSYPVGIGAFKTVYVTNRLNEKVIEPALNDIEEKIQAMGPLINYFR